MYPAGVYCVVPLVGEMSGYRGAGKDVMLKLLGLFTLFFMALLFSEKIQQILKHIHQFF